MTEWTKLEEGNGWVLLGWEGVPVSGSFQPLDLGGYRLPIYEFSMSGVDGGMTTTIAGGDVPGEADDFPALKDPSGNDITFTTAGRALSATSPLIIKPRVSGGSGALHNIRVLVRHERR